MSAYHNARKNACVFAGGTSKWSSQINWRICDAKGIPFPEDCDPKEDDPIIPADDLNRIDPVENLQIETHRYGGHCGFIENLAARSWIEGRILRILPVHM